MTSKDINLKRVLVANRGEIACRIFRTVHKLGLTAIAVYHHEDRNARHVEEADEAYELTGDTSTAAYLDAAQIVEICRVEKISAVHPGYGFLAENADFAERLAQAGIAFIGPEAEVIRTMGDKIAARAFVTKHNVPVAPSVTQTDDLDAFLADAAKLTFPVLIKAAAGGGGKGMNIVRKPDELAEQARLSAGEAERYFADGRIYAERYVEQPRHIEVQVLGDGAGNAIHLFERECSIQRRFQKIIEEAPAPNLPKKLRDKICATAVKIASASKYRNAGTVEFILAPDGEFYFLEMNTRLQVEHPITELITGIDLVEEQLRIADGQSLRYKQQDIKASGHAIECRICAEEPDRDFMPATGTIHLLRAPEGEAIRFDSGVHEGLEVTASFDPMLAKLIVDGETREQAIARAIEALHALIILGVESNTNYLARVLAHAQFAAEEIHTGFVVDYADDLVLPPLDDDMLSAVLGTAALALPEFRRAAFEMPEPYASIGEWRN